jgi:hypothetical protein
VKSTLTAGEPITVILVRLPDQPSCPKEAPVKAEGIAAAAVEDEVR